MKKRLILVGLLMAVLLVGVSVSAQQGLAEVYQIVHGARGLPSAWIYADHDASLPVLGILDWNIGYPVHEILQNGYGTWYRVVARTRDNRWQEVWVLSSSVEVTDRWMIPIEPGTVEDSLAPGQVKWYYFRAEERMQYMTLLESSDDSVFLSRHGAWGNTFPARGNLQLFWWQEEVSVSLYPALRADSGAADFTLTLMELNNRKAVDRHGLSDQIDQVTVYDLPDFRSAVMIEVETNSDQDVMIAVVTGDSVYDSVEGNNPSLNYRPRHPGEYSVLVYGLGHDQTITVSISFVITPRSVGAIRAERN